VALALSEELLSPLGDRAACRLHGGGFAGTVQAFVPTSFTERYKAGMEAIFGPDSCTVLSVRKEGALRIL
jgi:galactokinase